MENSKLLTVELYLFELTERASRFYMHLDDIKKQFYEFNTTVKDKLIFIQSYKDCILKILNIAANISHEISKGDHKEETYKKCLYNIKESLASINNLHREFLSHLPRPSEPIELRRFSRIIDKHVVKLSEDGIINKSDSQKKELSIYISEEIGDSVYSKDPLSNFKEINLNRVIENFNNAFIESPVSSFEKQNTNNSTIHITIPRIDASNPCRWPTLIHELGHNIIHEDFFKTGDILSDFRSSLMPGQISFIEDFEVKRKIMLKSWLTECWCDLFACTVFGPAFWFSQYVSFIFETGTNDDEIYPKPLFRLKLIYNILLHRFSGTLFSELKETIELSETIVEHFDKEDSNGFNNDEDLREMYMYFRTYFRKYFFKEKDSKLQFETEILNKKLSPLIKYTEEIEEVTIRELEEYLSLGLPIPGKNIKEGVFSQKPTYVQEILLAAWYFRNNGLKKSILKDLNLLYSVKPNDFIQSFEQGIFKIFKKFDESILRSIQVSEWFDLFYDINYVNESINLEKELTDSFDELSPLKNQLVDIEIFNLLQKKIIKIIPIINLKEQLGSTSLDLRLGTSFQLYYQTKYGVIDFSDSQSLHEAEFNSNLIDLDFLESITISPGQFLLAHTMEYLKLPENIAAEIEGRSSFARLGLEIHMTAGFVDPGFEGVITLEIYNAGPNPVKLFPGIRIAQLKFIPINIPLRPYNKKNDAKYKGLLSHHTSKQFKDYEISKIKDAKSN